MNSQQAMLLLGRGGSLFQQNHYIHIKTKNATSFLISLNNTKPSKYVPEGGPFILVQCDSSQ